MNIIRDLSTISYICFLFACLQLAGCDDNDTSTNGSKDDAEALNSGDDDAATPDSKDQDAQVEDSAQDNPDSGTPACYEDPKTHKEIINACTDAEAVDKDPELPLLLPNGELPPLP